MALSCSSTRIHRSSIRRDCSGSYLLRSALESAARAARTAGEDIGMVRDENWSPLA